MMDLLRSAIDLEEKLMDSMENLNKLSSSPSSKPSHESETTETAGSAQAAQESNAPGAAKTEAGLAALSFPFVSSRVKNVSNALFCRLRLVRSNEKLTPVAERSSECD